MIRSLARAFVPAILPFAATVVVVPAQSGWREPPAPIARAVLAPPPPNVSLSPGGSFLVLAEHEAMPPLEVVARPHLKLAGLRIDPASRGPQIGARTTRLVLRALPGGEEHRV
ncbi:MAG: hypothetical protein KDE27_29990, partial [Planctomycetes bacterium]|nr:hypothetical protein [Planctomycetota bacterium]